ncbi:MAG: hypothetical protein GC201_05185 [Alphaproteobacteria bacterium]|nr:hypothetical protein [Alphaproteobacteria bacterium]
MELIEEYRLMIEDTERHIAWLGTADIAIGDMQSSIEPDWHLEELMAHERRVIGEYEAVIRRLEEGIRALRAR